MYHILGPSHIYKTDPAISDSLRKCLKGKEDLASLGLLPTTGECSISDSDALGARLKGRIKRNPGDYWHQYHHDDISLDRDHRRDRNNKWIHNQSAWYAESARLRHSLLCFEDIKRFGASQTDGTEQWFNGVIMDTYTDLIVERSSEQPQLFPSACRVSYMDPIRQIDVPLESDPNVGRFLS